MPGFAGFLSGFNQETDAARARQDAEVQDQLNFHRGIYQTLLEHSEDPNVQAAAFQGMASIARGDYQPKGLARFLGRPGSVPSMTPAMGAVLAALKHPGGGATGAPEPGTGTTAMPTTSAGTTGVTGGPGAVPPPTPAGGATAGENAEELPTTGLAALKTGGAPTPGANAQPTAPAPTPTATPSMGPTKPIGATPAAAGAVAPPPPAPVGTFPGAPTFPTLESGQVALTPHQQQTYNAQVQAYAATLPQEQRFNFLYPQYYQQFKGMNMEDAQAQQFANMMAIRGSFGGNMPMPRLLTNEIADPNSPTGVSKQTTAVDPFTGEPLFKSAPIPGIMAPGTGRAPNPVEQIASTLFPEAFGPGVSPALAWSKLTPEQRAQAIQVSDQRGINTDFYKKQNTPFTITNPDLSTTRSMPTAPAVLPPLRGGGGATPPPAPTVTTAAPTASATPPPAPSGAPKIGDRVGTGTTPEAPMNVPPGITAPPKPGEPPQGTPQPTPGAAPSAQPPRTGVQTSPPLSLDPHQQAKKGTTGAEYIDESQIPDAKVKAKLAHDAEAMGIRVLNPSQAAAMTEFQTASANLTRYTEQLMPYLAATPAGRLRTSINNYLAELTQTNPELAAMAAEWTTSIEALKSTAGTIRVTFPEIAKALEGLPEQTDDVATARTKLADIKGMIGRAENAVLPPPRAVTDAVTDGSLTKGHAFLIPSGPGAGQEWGYYPDGVFRRVK